MSVVFDSFFNSREVMEVEEQDSWGYRSKGGRGERWWGLPWW